MNMESAAKNVGSENGVPQFRKCVYPYCRNMALATVDYCEMHKHSTLLIKHPRLKNPVKKIAVPAETNWKKVLAAPKVKVTKKTKKSKTSRPPARDEDDLLVTIVLTANEALETGVALSLADLINADRFKNAEEISGKILKAIVKQIPQHDVEEAS
jgi:hypothetical protein